MFGIPEEVFTDLVAHYQNLGLNAQLIEKQVPEAFDKETTIKIGGRQFDSVILKFAGGSMAVGRGGGVGLSYEKGRKKTYPDIRFHHIVKGLKIKSEEDLKAEMKEKKKGFISKKLVGVDWEGGKLASLLNGDAELNKKILETNTTSLKVEPDMKNNCARIIHQKRIELVVESGGFIVKKTETKAKNFPPIATIDIVDRIAGHVKSV